MDDLNDIHTLHSLPEVDEYNTLGILQDIQEIRNFIEVNLKDKRSVHGNIYVGRHERNPIRALSVLRALCYQLKDLIWGRSLLNYYRLSGDWDLH
jgi:hypothetical protein